MTYSFVCASDRLFVSRIEKKLAGLRVKHFGESPDGLKMIFHWESTLKTLQLTISTRIYLDHSNRWSPCSVAQLFMARQIRRSQSL